MLRRNIVITQDIDLASLVLPKGASALSPRGREYTNENIDTALDFRYLAAKARCQGEYEKGPKAFHVEDGQLYFSSLVRILSKNVTNH